MTMTSVATERHSKQNLRDAIGNAVDSYQECSPFSVNVAACYNDG